MLTVRSLNVAYDRPVLRDVSLTVPDGEIRTVLGPSGCGKTTLIYTIAGLRKPSSGQIMIDGSEPAAGRRDIAVILQDYGLLPWKTVKQNIELGLVLRKLSAPERVDHIIESLGLAPVAHHYPAELSGGQRQRVAIGRALAVEPSLLLMDEPFSALDAITREELQNLYLRLWENRPMTTLLVTHSIDEAAFLGQRILVFSGQPGTLIAEVPNPTFGEEDPRSDSQFYDLCTELRRYMEQARQLKSSAPQE